MNKNTKVSNETQGENEQSLNSLFQKDNMLPEPITVDADGRINGNLYAEELTGKDSVVAPEEDIAFYRKNLDRIYNSNSATIYENNSSLLSRCAIVMAGILLTVLLSVCYLLLPKKPTKQVTSFE
jgi:hypothetical protein